MPEAPLTLGDPHRTREAVHRFVSTVKNLQWWGDPGYGPLHDGPLWRPEEWDHVAEAAAESMHGMSAATEVSAALEEIRAAANPVADTNGVVRARPAEVRQAAFEKCRALVDEIAADRASAAERRIAAARVADVRSYARFADHADYTNETSLTVAVAALELLVGELVRAFHLRYPDSLKGSDRKFGVMEILDALDRGQDLRDRVLDEAVNSVIGRSPAAVRQWFEDHRVLDLDLNCPHMWEDVAETFERRHTIVHSGAEVTPRYAALVKNSPEVGTSLRITDMYMEHALGGLLGFGVSLATEVLAKLYPSDALAAVVMATGLVRPLQYWGDRSTDPWPLLKVLVRAVDRAATAASGPDAQGLRTAGRLLSLWWAWNSRAVHEGVPPSETIKAWEPESSVVEQFAAAALAQDDEKALALADSAVEHPDFALLVLLPREVKAPVSAAAVRLKTERR